MKSDLFRLLKYLHETTLGSSTPQTFNISKDRKLSNLLTSDEITSVTAHEITNSFTNIAGNYEWKTDEVLIFLLVGLATIAFPEIIPYLCEKYMQYVLAI